MELPFQLGEELYSHSVMSNSLQPPGLQHTFLSFTISQSLLKLMSFESMMLSNHLILCHPILLLPSILPMDSQGLFPVGLTGLISLLSKGLSRVFSSTTFESINSFVLSLLYDPTLTSVHDYWKNHSLDYTDLCQQSDVSAF